MYHSATDMCYADTSTPWLPPVYVYSHIDILHIM